MPEGEPTNPLILEIRREAIRDLRSRLPLSTDDLIPLTEEKIEERFIAKKAEFEEKYGEQDVRFIFHGTSEQAYNSIINQGFLAPGDPGYRMTTGNVHGRGFYGSRDFSMVERYGQFIIVCACILGKVGKTTCSGQDIIGDTGINGNIIVLRNSKQVLPIYAFKKALFTER